MKIVIRDGQRSVRHVVRMTAHLIPVRAVVFRGAAVLQNVNRVQPQPINARRVQQDGHCQVQLAGKMIAHHIPATVQQLQIAAEQVLANQIQP